MDVEAALKTRLTSLSLGGKGALLGTTSSTPLDLVFEKPTVIELKEIQNDEEKAFVAALLLMDMAAWAQVRGQSKELRHFTLIEEAHRLLPNVSTEKGDPESADPRRRTVEQFGNMLAELRAYGEGLAVVEQIPTKILSDAIKNTATKVVHRVPAFDDRKVMAGAMNATKEQAAAFTALGPREAVLSLEGHPVPVRVEVEDVVSKIKSLSAKSRTGTSRSAWMCSVRSIPSRNRSSSPGSRLCVNWSNLSRSKNPSCRPTASGSRPATQAR